MAEVRAHDDERARLAEELEHEVGRARRSELGDRDGQEREAVPERPLEEGELDLDRVLGRVRGVVDGGARGDGAEPQRGVDRHGAERRLPDVGGGHGGSADGHPVDRAERDDARDRPGVRPQARVRARGDGPGVDEARVRDDERGGRRGGGLSPGAGEHVVHHLRQLHRVVRVEHPGHGGSADARAGRGAEPHDAARWTGRRRVPQEPGDSSKAPAQTAPQEPHRPPAARFHSRIS